MSRTAPSIVGAVAGSALTLVGTVILPLHSRAFPARPIETADAHKSPKLFAEVFGIVHAGCVDKPIDAKLVAGSTKGMLPGPDPLRRALGLLRGTVINAAFPLSQKQAAR